MNSDFTLKVKLAQQGDAAAFSELYALIYKDLYYVAYYTLKNTYDAQDVVSDAVLDAFSSIGKLKDEGAFKAWIMRILSAKINRKIKEYIRDRVVLTYDFEHEELNYDGIDLKQEFNKLSHDERLVLSLSVVSGYTSEEISRITGINAGTVRSKLSRAKDKLRERLASV